MSRFASLRQHCCFVLLGAMLLASPLYGALPPVDGEGRELPSLAPMLERVTPAVVNIATLQRVPVRDNPLLMDPFFQRFFGIPNRPRHKEKQNLGSGVVVDAENGYILTNNHVVDKADEITVTLRDGRSLQATVLGADPDADVAVIQVEPDGLIDVERADSDQLQVGDFVVAIGNPFGLGQTVTSGIVSALGRSGLGIEGYEDFIQTDASINPGNSGGALVNLRGELVGINTAIIAPGGGNVGIGFAIPIKMAYGIMEDLVKHGEVRRGHIGISVQELTPALAQAFGLDDERGVIISRIVAGSVAERAGIEVGDVLVKIGNKRIASQDDVRNAVGLLRVGRDSQVTVIREGDKKIIPIEVEERRGSVVTQGKEIHSFFDGSVFKDIDETSRLHGRVSGVYVADVKRRSNAAEAGLRPGDVIVSINRLPIASADDLREKVQGVSRMLVHVRRGDGALFLLLK